MLNLKPHTQANKTIVRKHTTLVAKSDFNYYAINKWFVSSAVVSNKMLHARN